MLQEEIQKWFRKTFSRGVNSDVNKDMLPEGFGTMLRNMRVTSVDGDTGSAEAIKGEELLYDDQSPAGYKCIGSFHTSDHIGSFHAPLVDGPVILKVDGDTVLASESIPYRWDRDLQIATVDRKQGPIVFPVDGESEALFFDINLILNAYNSGSQEFFSGLNLQNISVLPSGPDEWPEFTELVDVGTGLAPGQYSYWLRYVFVTGDRSNPGPPTPHISVPGVQAPVYWTANIDPSDPGAAAGNRQYPGGQTTGGLPSIDEQTPSRYGVRLRFVIENTNGATKVEVIRQKFIGGAGLDGPGVVEIVGSLDLIPGARQEFVWTDPADAILVGDIPTDETVREYVNFTAPKSVEHVDNSVVYANIKLRDRIPLISYKEVDGRKIFPVTTKVATKYDGEQYNDGFSDPVNNTYLKSAQHLETYGVGLLLWDGGSSKSVVSEVGEITMPARADRKNGDSLKYSTDPIYRANIECQGDDPVSPTFDAIVQGTVGKAPNLGGYVNVHLGDPDNPLNYNPWAPKGPTDPNFVRYRVKPIVGRNVGGVTLPDQGFLFSPEVHSLGAGIYGPQNIEEAAPWAKVISVMRTDPADAVVAEGIGSYSILDGATADKAKNEIDVFFPDMNDAIVSQSVQDEISANPSNYYVRVTPYGFYTEEYGWWNPPGISVGEAAGSVGIDMISYAGIQRDPGTVNVGDGAPQGFQPTLSAPPTLTNNVGYSAWRGQPNGNSIFQASPQQGAHEFPISSFQRLAEGRGVKWKIRTLTDFYHTQVSGFNFADAATREFHEGMYVASLMRRGASLSNANIQKYKFTGQHIARERSIGVYGTQAGQYELFHARLYDCLGRTGLDNRYIYIQEEGQAEKRYLCATGNVSVGFNFNAIVSSINTQGFWTDTDGNRIHGLYNILTYDNQPRPAYYAEIGGYGQLPQPSEGARIVVKYDKREPIVSNGFDCTIAPTIFAPIDRVFTSNFWQASSGNTATSVRTRAPLPYSGGTRNPDYILPGRILDQNDPNYTNDPNALRVAGVLNGGQYRSIRQWVVMAHLVTRSPQHMLVAGERSVFPFPRTHYVIRPAYIWSDASGAANGFNAQYDIDYPGEVTQFLYGGFRFWSGTNLDYAKQPLDNGVSAPRNGVQQSNDLPCMYIKSERLDPLAADLPGLRTFYSDNMFPVSEENGEIKFIASLDQGSMQQLYGWSERGFHRIPYNKSILTGADGETIGSQSVSNFWPREEIWLSRGAKGMPEEMWKLAVKAHGPVGETTMDTVLWADKQGAYQLVGARAVDISRGRFSTEILPYLNETNFTGQTKAASMFNPKNGEWWMMTPTTAQGGLRAVTTVHVFSLINREWVGRFDYVFDKFLSKDNELYGMRGLKTYELDKGYVINGSVREAYAETFIAPYLARQSELIAWRVHPDKPDELRVYDKKKNLMLVTNEQLQEAFEAGTGEYWVMWIDAWQQMMNCVSEQYAQDFNVEQQPPQSTGYYLRIYFRRPEEQQITFLEAQAKIIP